MQVDTFENIFAEYKIAYALFNSDLALECCSQSFSKVMPGVPHKKQSSLWDMVPELVGSEQIVQDVLQGITQKYSIEKLNKYTEKQKLYYYDLTLFSTKEESSHQPQLMLVVADRTSEISLEQRIQQQKFEIVLLQSTLARSVKPLSAEIIGDSKQIQSIREFVTKISQYHSSIVLLEGESGTGKNLVAQLIHHNSTPANAPYVEINCASIPSNLIESEVFGYEKGAFTNAISAKHGLLEEADGGTFFLDEISELPLVLQSKFLSFLETKKFRRLGSTQERSVNTRIIAATNQNLQSLVEKKEFRLDLFFRVNVLQLRLPALREMGDDIFLIADYFCNIYSFEFKKRINGFSAAAKAKLLDYSWPGNVRELRNVIERAVIFASDEVINADDILLLIEQKSKSGIIEDLDRSENLTLFEMEKQLIYKALKKAQGNQTRAAQLLGLSLDTLRYRIKKYEIAFDD